MGALDTLQPSPDLLKQLPARPATEDDNATPHPLGDLLGGLAEPFQSSSYDPNAIGAAFRATKDGIWAVKDYRLSEAYAPIVDQLLARQGKGPNATDQYWDNDWPAWLGISGSDWDGKKIWRDIDNIRASDPNAFAGLPADQQTFEKQVLTRNGQHLQDSQIAAKAGWVPNLIGGAGASFFDPVNLAGGMLLGRLTAGMGLLRGTLTSAAGNAALSLAEAPVNAQTRAQLGDQTTLADVLHEAEGAALVGAGFHLGAAGLSAVAKAFSDRVPTELQTPDERAALNVINRNTEILDASPFDPSMAADDLHKTRLAEAMNDLADQRAPGDSPAFSAPAPQPEGAAPSYLQRLARAETGGDPTAHAKTSSASGLYQFTDGTWLHLYRQRFGQNGISDAAALELRNQPGVRDVLIGDLTRGNARYLAGHGVPVDDASLYAAHFAGPKGAVDLMRAPEDMPVEQVLGDKVVRANPFLKGLNAGEARAELARRIGARPGAEAFLPEGSAGGDVQTAENDLFAARMAEMDREELDDAYGPEEQSRETAGQAGAILDANGSPQAEILGADLTRGAGSEPQPFPNLRADMFADESSRRVAQATLEAQAYGLPNPDRTRAIGMENPLDLPIHSRSFDPRELTTDAAAMQYKQGGDASGVTDRLRDDAPWVQAFSGKAMVFERSDGSFVIADGHQRLGKALREIAKDPNAKIWLNADVMREQDGWTAAQARVAAALKNIAEGSGDVTDAARVLRENPSLEHYLPRSGTFMRMARGISRLDHESFGAVLNGVLSPEHASAIGNYAGHLPETHVPLMNLLTQAAPRHNETMAAQMVRQALADGFGSSDAGNQLSMFGDRPAQALYAPMAKVLENAKKLLREDKKIFGRLVEAETKITGVGANTLDRDANSRKVLTSEQAQIILDKTAQSTGPVRDALREAASGLLDRNQSLANATRQFIEKIEGIDLRDAAAGSGANEGDGASFYRSGGGDIDAEPSGSLFGRSETAGGIEQSGSYGGEKDLFQNIGEAARDEAIAQGAIGAPEPPEPGSLRFDDAGTAEDDALAETVWHDLLAAEGEGGGEATEAWRELQEDQRALDAIKGCLAPPKGA